MTRELTEISFVSRAIPVVVRPLGLGTASAETKIVLDDADSGRVFEGIGAISQGGTSRNMVDYPAKLKSEIFDYMFKPKFGANLQHFKVEIGGGENGTCGSEPTHALTREELTEPMPRGFEFWLMAEARKRNPQVMLDCLPWSYPYWVSSPFSQDSADWYVAFLDVAKKHYGLKMDWVAAAWNEHGTDMNWIAKTLRPTLDAHGYADVKLQAPDEDNKSWLIFDEMEKNPVANKVLQAVGYHYPSGWVRSSSWRPNTPPGRPSPAVCRCGRARNSHTAARPGRNPCCWRNAITRTTSVVGSPRPRCGACCRESIPESDTPEWA